MGGLLDFETNLGLGIQGYVLSGGQSWVFLGEPVLGNFGPSEVRSLGVRLQGGAVCFGKLSWQGRLLAALGPCLAC